MPAQKAVRRVLICRHDSLKLRSLTSDVAQPAAQLQVSPSPQVGAPDARQIGGAKHRAMIAAEAKDAAVRCLK